MTPEQLQQTVAAAQIAARDVALDWLLPILSAVAKSQGADVPSQTATAATRKLSQARADFQQLAFPDLSPEQSDHLAAELQEAFDVVARKIVLALQAE